MKKRTLNYIWLAIRPGMAAPVVSREELKKDGYWSQVVKTTPGRLHWYVMVRHSNGQLVLTTTRQARRYKWLILHRCSDLIRMV